MLRRLLVTAAAVALTGLYARADIKLPAILSDNMCLQAGKTVPIWGKADPGELVTVTLGEQKQSAAAGADGKWMVKLNGLKAGESLAMTVSGKNSITVKNIIVGEVWVASGQSNMEFGFKQAHNVAEETPKAKYPQIRLFNLKKKIAFTPQEDCEGHWDVCSPETVQFTSAVGYFFARDIHEALKTPVGLIHTSWGGTPAEAWTSIEDLQGNPALQSYAERFNKTKEDLEDAKSKYKTEVLAKYEAAKKAWDETGAAKLKAMQQKYQQEVAAAKAAGQPAPAAPRYPQPPRYPAAPDNNPNLGSVLYNGMIAPIVPFAIEGAIWYQGESNAGQSMQYRTLFPTMITDWRKHWSELNPDEKDFPFLFVQLANFMARQPEPVQEDTGWPGLREAQHMTLSLPNTGEAVIIDVGQENDIHPRDKMDVGHRLALAGLKVAYHKELVYSGPTYQSLAIEGDKARVKFTNIGGGLKIAAHPSTQPGVPQASPDSELRGFSIAGEDHKFYWADAKIDGDSVVVWSDKVSKPAAVRYAWANNPDCNLYNKEGIPASPFRTDTWTAAPVARK
jgi:sialate O-acetylesterase